MREFNAHVTEIKDRLGVVQGSEKVDS